MQYKERGHLYSNLQYLNVQLLGLSGRPHPALHHVRETREAFKMRAHIQLLAGDFPHNEVIGRHGNSDPRCSICPGPVESTQHLLTECSATAAVRERLLPELLNVIADIHPTHGLLDHTVSNINLTQFILDPTSANLNNRFRISPQHIRLAEIFRISRDWCYAVTSSRKKQLKVKKKTSNAQIIKHNSSCNF